MKHIKVSLEGGKYSIHIGAGAYGLLGEEIKEKGCSYYIVSDSMAWELYGERLLNVLPEEPSGITLVRGESNKNMNTVSDILEDCARSQISRSDCIISFGGGVCGDIAGFCAAIYMRGIEYHQVPTTLLSQVDSSIGGKTAVDLIAGKNLAGCIKQPAGVYIDPAVLETLPLKELRQGKAEMIKTALIYDPLLCSQFEEGVVVNSNSIKSVIEIKLGFVKSDEYDKGDRMLLNFGHTIGHALEKKVGFGNISHGDAIAIGMAEITRISESAGLSDKGTAEYVETILKANGLPVDLEIPVSELKNEIASDKKNINKKLNLSLIQKPGEAFIYPVDIDKFIKMAGDV